MAVTLAPPLLRAIVCPDPATWAAVGTDLRDLGFDPVTSPHRADTLVTAERLPEGFAEPLRETLDRLGGSHQLLAGAPLGGRPVEELLQLTAEADHGEDEEDEGGDHGDMMAVTGDPSDDGLVMEDAEAVIGPLSGPLPAGLRLALTLDGDVVCGLELTSALEGDGPLPDPFARRASEWALARDRANPTGERIGGTHHLIATELERALGHSLWLARLCELIGWAAAAEELSLAAGGLIEAHAAPLVEVGAALSDGTVAELDGALEAFGESDAARRRMDGIARVEASRCRELAITGPVARASGLALDARSTDPAYGQLGFEPVLVTEGDAWARARLRATEARRALELADLAREAGELPLGEGPVEGPRGRIAPHPSAGEAVALQRGALAGLIEEAANGYELARSLLAVASFDPSPWELGR